MEPYEQPAGLRCCCTDSEQLKTAARIGGCIAASTLVAIGIVGIVMIVSEHNDTAS